MVQFPAYRFQERCVVSAILWAFAIAAQASASRIFPVEINAVEHGVSVEEIIDRLSKPLPSCRRRAHVAEIPGERPATDRDAGPQMRILRLELGNLVEVTPDGLLRSRIVSRVIPKIRLTTHRLSSRETFFGGCITIKQDHFTLRRQIRKRIDEMS